MAARCTSQEKISYMVVRCIQIDEFMVLLAVAIT